MKQCLLSRVEKASTNAAPAMPKTKTSADSSQRPPRASGTRGRVDLDKVHEVIERIIRTPAEDGEREAVLRELSRGS